MRFSHILLASILFTGACGDGNSSSGMTFLSIDGTEYPVRNLTSSMWWMPGSGNYHYLLSFETEDAVGDEATFSVSLRFPNGASGNDTKLTVEEHEVSVDVIATHCGGFEAVSCESDLAGAFAWLGTFNISGTMRSDATLLEFSLTFDDDEESSKEPGQLALDFEGALVPRDCFQMDECRIELQPNATTP